MAVLRLLVAFAVVGLLGRTLRPAWRNRWLALRVWSGLRPRHAVGAVLLLGLVLVVAVGLDVSVPATRVGLGSLVGFEGNAVFAPLEEASRRSGGQGLAQPAVPQTPGGVNPVFLAVAGGFLLVLLVLFPWLAYVEERVFREGLETASLRRELWVALRFGLVHMVMLIPLSAALAVGVAGFAYGRVYRHGYARAARRARAATGPFGLPVAGPVDVERCRDEAVLAATRWHVAVNSLIVVGVFLAVAQGAV